MPRNSVAEETRVRAKVEAFLKDYSVLDQPPRRLSIAYVARELHISRDTLRKYKIDMLIRGAAQKPKGKRRRTVDQRLVDALEEAVQWKARYKALACDHVVLVNYLKHSPSIDVDAILSRSLPKAMRASPAGRRRFGR